MYNSPVPHASSAEGITSVPFYDILSITGYLLMEHDIYLDLRTLTASISNLFRVVYYDFYTSHVDAQKDKPLDG